jgi:glycosyltransferase involved in cell wall biosynthesis
MRHAGNRPLYLSEPDDSALRNALRASGSVIIDALAARYGGTAYAAVQIAHRLADGSHGEEVVLVTRAGSLVAEGIRRRPGLRVLLLSSPKRFELAERLLWEADALPKLVRRERAASVLSWSGMLPRSVAAPVVCYLANPVMLERGGVANRLRRWAARRTLRDAAHVLVPSRATGARVAEVLERVPEVVPLGVDHTHFRPAGEPGNDVLCVADFYRHKRQDVLLEAWAESPAPRPRLRLIGSPQVDLRWYAHVERQAERLRGLGEITLESGLRLSELVGAYHAARVFALPSTYESFCLPLLEAQACGVPAVVCDSAALRETGGAGTTYLDSDDAREWAAALRRLLVDDAAHARARALGLEQAGRFSWERTADAVRSRLSTPERERD